MIYREDNYQDAAVSCCVLATLVCIAGAAPSLQECSTQLKRSALVNSCWTINGEKRGSHIVNGKASPLHDAIAHCQQPLVLPLRIPLLRGTNSASIAQLLNLWHTSTFQASQVQKLSNGNGQEELGGRLPDMHRAIATKMSMLRISNTSLEQCSAAHLAVYQDGLIDTTLKAGSSDHIGTDNFTGCLPDALVFCELEQMGTSELWCPSLAFRRPLQEAISQRDVVTDMLQMLAVTDSLVQAAADLAPAAVNLTWPSRAVACGPTRTATDRPIAVDGGLGRDDVTIVYDQSFFSYVGCRCSSGYDNVYIFDDAGRVTMDCTPSKSRSRGVTAMLASVIRFVIMAPVVLLIAMHWQRILGELAQIRINRVKHGKIPGTISAKLTQELGLVHKEVTLVMTDVQASSKLWEWDARVMDQALSMHDACLRSVLHQDYGYEVATEGDAFTMAFHDPIDAISWCLEAHHVTRQVEYRGDVISLTEALVGFTAGGQILLSDAAYQRIYGCLHMVKFEDQMRKQQKKGAFTWLSRSAAAHAQSAAALDTESTTLQAVLEQSADSAGTLPVQPSMGKPLSPAPSTQKLLPGQSTAQQGSSTISAKKLAWGEGLGQLWRMPSQTSGRQAPDTPQTTAGALRLPSSLKAFSSGTWHMLVKRLGRREQTEVQGSLIGRMRPLPTDTSPLARSGTVQRALCALIDMGAFYLAEFASKQCCPIEGAAVHGGLHVLQVVAPCHMCRLLHFPLLSQTIKVLSNLVFFISFPPMTSPS
ncbi:hypothetical protein ABBQ38_006526 [Trebouxia sp. C0009 RCD-2024]